MNIEYEIQATVTPEEFEALGNSFNGEHPRPVQLNKKALDGSWFVGCARDREKLIGIIRLVGDGAYIVHIADLLVHPDYQGKRIGSTLMKLAIDYARQMKVGTGTEYGEFTLFSTTKGNNFYRKFEFVPVPNGMCLADHPCRLEAEGIIQREFKDGKK